MSALRSSARRTGLGCMRPEGEEVRYDGALVSHWVGDQIALWHRDTGEMEVLYNLYDIFDPWSYPNVAEPNS